MSSGAVFGSHLYMWNGKLYRQMQGAPMGLRSSCPVSRAVMDYWVQNIMDLEEKMGLLADINPIQFERLETYLIEKYVDDVLTALNKLRKGVRWSHTQKALIWSAEDEILDKDKTQEEVTMLAFSEMVSSILKCLQFTWDVPNQDNRFRMPVLDTVMWVGTPTRVQGIPDALLESETTQLAHTGQHDTVLILQVANVKHHTNVEKDSCHSVRSFQVT